MTRDVHRRSGSVTTYFAIVDRTTGYALV